MSDTRYQQLLTALSNGVERMRRVLAEYAEAGEMERPFVIGCKEWTQSAEQAIAAARPPADAPADTLGPPNWSERAPEPRYQGLANAIRGLVLCFALTERDLAERAGAEKMREAVLQLLERLAAAEPRGTTAGEQTPHAAGGELREALNQLLVEWREKASKGHKLYTLTCAHELEQALAAQTSPAPRAAGGETLNYYQTARDFLENHAPEVEELVALLQRVAAQTSPAAGEGLVREIVKLGEKINKTAAEVRKERSEYNRLIDEAGDMRSTSHISTWAMHNAERRLNELKEQSFRLVARTAEHPQPAPEGEKS